MAATVAAADADAAAAGADPDPPLPAESEAGEEDADRAQASHTDGAKKKKKKPRKKPSTEARSAPEAQPVVASATPTQDANERFQSTLEMLRGDDSALWADCSRCGLAEKKLRKLLAALRSNPRSPLTSLDLSHNMLTDEAARSLLSALDQEPKLVPGLVELSLVGNPISEAGVQACAQAVAGRPSLELKLPTASDLATANDTIPQPTGDCNEAFGAFFASRISATADAPGAGASPGEGGGADPASLTFESATAALMRGQVDSVETTDALAFLMDTVQAESQGGPPASGSKMLPRAMRWCSLKLSLLTQLLQLGPPCLGHPKAPARLGSHRLRIVQLLHVLVAARRPPLTHAIASSSPNVVCETVKLLQAHPWCGMLHTYLVRLVSAALEMKPLRTAMVVSPHRCSALQAILCDVLVDNKAQLAGSARPTALELAAALHAAAQGDKSLETALRAEGRWPKAVEAVSKYREDTRRKWDCGEPPARPNGAQGLGGEMGELLAALSRMQADS